MYVRVISKVFSYFTGYDDNSEFDIVGFQTIEYSTFNNRDANYFPSSVSDNLQLSLTVKYFPEYSKVQIRCFQLSPNPTRMTSVF